MEQLISGIARFNQALGSAERAYLARQARGQAPQALFITCSDSRVVPQLFTQAKPGELFVLQNAGALVPRWRQGAPHGSEAATIEFAVEGLRVPDIVVCAHTRCGALTALCDPEPKSGLPALTAWLRHAAPARARLKRTHPHLRGAALVAACTRQNVLVQLANLQTHPSVASACAAGRLRLHGWLYSIETGGVRAWDSKVGRFTAITAPHRASAARRRR